MHVATFITVGLCSAPECCVTLSKDSCKKMLRNLNCHENYSQVTFMPTCNLCISLWSLLMSALFWVSFCCSSSSLCLSLPSLSLSWVVSRWTVVTCCSSWTSFCWVTTLFCWRSASSLVFSSYFNINFSSGALTLKSFAILRWQLQLFADNILLWFWP
jgi:hypothetical protein